MHNNEEIFIKKLLSTLDFSKFNPSHKERLRQTLSEQNRELNEAELENVYAAGTSFATETQLNKETDIQRKPKN